MTNETYHRRAIESVPLDRERCLARVPDSGEQVPVARAALEMVSRCTGFHTVDEHIASLLRASRLPEAHRGDLTRALAELAERGFLIGRGELLARMRARRDASATPTSIGSIGVLTRDRPRAVARCLDSYVGNTRAHDRRCAFTVIDSSPTAELRAQTRDAVGALAAGGASELRYADVADKARFAARLALEAGVDPDLVRFALLDPEGIGCDTGANRNALLLEHAGRPFLSVDDDMICELRRRSDDPSAALAVGSADPTLVTCVRNLAVARAATRTIDECVLGLHERLLGRSVAACLSEVAPTEVAVDDLAPSALERLLGGGAQVAATVGGFFGDSGADYPSFYLFSSAIAGRDQLADDEATYRAVVASRHVLRAPCALSVSSGGFCASGNLALDARALLPPFFPVSRGEDLLFGVVLRRCFDDRWLGYLPWASGHVPIEARRNDPARLWPESATVSLHSTVMHALSIANVEFARSGAPRLALLGRALGELAALPWPDLERLLRAQAWKAGAARLAALDAAIAAADPRVPWTRLARAFRHARGAMLADPVLPTPLLARRSPEEAPAALQRLLQRFGALLEAWPALFEAARRLGARDAGLARPVVDR